MKTVQAKRVKISVSTKYVGMFIACMVLASCSSGQNAFFAQRDALISQGYTWEQLDRCRPAKENTPSIPAIRSDGRKLVCYRLVPPQNGTAASIPATPSPAASSPATSTPKTPSPEAPSPATSTPATTPDTSSGTSGVIWNFSNF